MFVPQQRDIVWITFDPTLGHEQGGRRPAVVISGRGYSTRSNMAVVCPITSRRKRYPYEVTLPAELTTTGVILADHVRSLDITKRKVEFIEHAPEDVLWEVFDKLQSLLPGLCDSFEGGAP